MTAALRMGNVALRDMRSFLAAVGCERVSVEGGHEKWRRKGCLRPVVLQTHIDPVPEFIVRNALRTLGLSRSTLAQWLGR